MNKFYKNRVHGCTMGVRDHIKLLIPGEEVRDS